MPSDAYLLDWFNLVLRWAHVITGIAWVGSSFYFIWLDARLNVPPRDPEHADVAGDLWAVHGGGFYHSQKYRTAPAVLPEPLHWFMWEAYSTWLTGFALYAVVYYANAGALLVDPAVAAIDAGTAVTISLLLLPVGWLAYEALCRAGLRDGQFAIAGSLLVLLLCYGMCRLYGGRGAFMQVGVMLGTIMAANVWRVIIPAQRELVAARRAGAEPDAAQGARAKQRSVHNNYLTLPVVLVMISPHFAFTYGTSWRWLVLFALFVGGALVRHFFNLRNRGRLVVALPVAAGVIGVALAIALAPRRPATENAAAPADPQVLFAQVNRIIQTRCVACHSAAPTHPAAPVAAAGVSFDTPRQIAAWAPRIFYRAVGTRTMPLANLTGMTESERAVIERWYASGARVAD